MKILGIDYGTRYIGLSIADEQIKIAYPYLVLKNKGRKFVLKELKKIIEKERIKKIIIGRPIGLSGKSTEQTKITDEFINFLKNNLSISVEGFDERFTSKMATDTRINTDQRGYLRKSAFDLRKSAKASQASLDEHSGAAAIILQGYLEKQKI